MDKQTLYTAYLVGAAGGVFLIIIIRAVIINIIDYYKKNK